RALAELHAAEELALEESRVRERDHDQVDDHEGLDQRDPPRLGHAGFTSTCACRPAAWSRAIRTVPARRSCAIRARSSTDVPFDLTTTSAPERMPRARASPADSSISGPGRWNWSSGTRSTAGPEKSGRYVTSRRPCSAAPTGSSSAPLAGGAASGRGRGGSDARSPISPK